MSHPSMCMKRENYTPGVAMRTNIEIDSDLMDQVLQATGLPSKRAAVEAALRLMLRLERQKDILELAGKVRWEGDLDASRERRRFDKE